MSDHTSGPWTVETNKVGPDMCEGMLVKPASGTAYVADTFVGRHGGMSREECEANARLITAAPDLLAACEAAYAWMPTMNVQTAHAVLVQLRDAIARATDQTPASP